MAKCPGCGAKLHLYNWKPECPHCGVNLNYFESNKRLLEESEKAEIEHSHFQPHIDRAKAAYVGSKLAILRIVFSLVPVLSLFIPAFQNDSGEKFNIIGIVKIFTSGDIGQILKDALAGNALELAVLLLALSVVLTVVSLALITMALGKHANIRVPITYGLIAVFGVASLVVLCFGSGVKPGAGIFVYAVLTMAHFIYNCVLVRVGIPVNYTLCRIGGLPSAEYFEYVNSGMSRDELNRKMLVALTNLEAEQKNEENQEEAAVNE